jgi:hypothetical protein
VIKRLFFSFVNANVFSRASIICSGLLVAAWLVRVGYLSTTVVDLQSVYVGNITFWAVVIVLFTLTLGLIDVICIFVAWRRSARGWDLAVRIFFITILIILVLLFVSIKILQARLINA